MCLWIWLLKKFGNELVHNSINPVKQDVRVEKSMGKSLKKWIILKEKQMCSKEQAYYSTTKQTHHHHPLTNNTRTLCKPTLDNCWTVIKEQEVRFFKLSKKEFNKLLQAFHLFLKSILYWWFSVSIPLHFIVFIAEIDVRLAFQSVNSIFHFMSELNEL